MRSSLSDLATPPAAKEISKDILDKIANPDANPTPKQIEGEGYEIEVDEFSHVKDIRHRGRLPWCDD